MTKDRLKSHPFAPKEEEQEQPQGEAQAASQRPATASRLRPVTTVMGESHIMWLDELCLKIRKRTGKAINRAEILRAAIDAIRETGIDLSAAGSEEEIKAVLKASLK